MGILFLSLIFLSPIFLSDCRNDDTRGHAPGVNTLPYMVKLRRVPTRKLIC